jgi:8-oxo-dGTP pyrophosphatase MutT (NUDIX family)
MPREYEKDIWRVYGRRAIYRSEWVELWLDDVEVPGVKRLEHHVIRFPRESVYAIVVRDDHILMLWRHRFITGEWGWEVPAGWVDSDEDPVAAVRREVEEETGWQPGRVEKLAEYNAQSGISDMLFSLFIMEAACQLGEPTDVGESSKVEWVPVAQLRSMIRDGKIKDGPSLLALTYYLSMCSD